MPPYLKFVLTVTDKSDLCLDDMKTVLCMTYDQIISIKDEHLLLAQDAILSKLGLSPPKDHFEETLDLCELSKLYSSTAASLTQFETDIIQSCTNKEGTAAMILATLNELKLPISIRYLTDLIE